MSQRELNRAIARATGETVREIEHMGFSEVVVPDDFGNRNDPAVLDWDALDELLASEDSAAEPPLLRVA